MKKIVILMNIGLFMLACGTTAFCELKNEDLPNREGIKIGYGNVVIHPAFKVQEELDSNVFLTNSDRKFDVITLLRPSVGMEAPMKTSNYSVDYATDIYFFGHYSEQDHIDHTIRGLVEIELADYKASLKDVYKRFTDRSGSENTARVKRQTNNLKADVIAEFERLGFDLSYTNAIEDYLSNLLVTGPLTYEDKSTIKNIFSLEASYRVLPKTSVLLESDLGFNHYYNSSASPDSYYTETLAGVKGEWLKRIVLNLRGGFRYQSYDSSVIISTKDYIGPVARGGADYYITDDDILTLGIERGIYESTYSNMNYYNVNMVKLDYTHMFNDKVAAKAFTSYQVNLYPSQTRENGEIAKRWDNIYETGVGVRYDIRKWVSVEADYAYKQRVSRFSVFDYKDNLVTLRGTVGF